MLSVLLATHNGSDTIERTLASMAELEPPAGGWKLVVVNNASTDDTEARILKWRDRLPMEYVVEPRLGKSFALNTALARAEGDFIVMTDDDVLPDRDWLTEWRRVADAYPQCSVFGGAIVPEFDGNPPDWPMPEWCHTVLYGKTPAYAEGEIAPENVSGANLCIRRAIYDAGWRFGEKFMVGSQGLMGEDSDLVRRLAAAGCKVGFSPHARVRHIIHKRQISIRWIQARLYRHARTMHMLHDGAKDDSASKPSFPRWRIRSAAAAAGRLLLTAPRGDKARMFELMLSIAYDLGAVRQAWADARR